MTADRPGRDGEHGSIRDQLRAASERHEALPAYARPIVTRPVAARPAGQDEACPECGHATSGHPDRFGCAIGECDCRLAPIPASSAARDGDSDPTEPAPLAQQLRDLIRANEQLTAERDEAVAAVQRVRAWVVSMDDLAREYREAAGAVRAPELIQQATNHAEDVQASADGVRLALGDLP